MEIKDIKDALVGEVKTATEAIEKAVDTKVKAASDATDVKIGEIKDSLAAIVKKLGDNKVESKNKTFAEQVKEGLLENQSKFKREEPFKLNIKLSEVDFNTKANMITANDLTGSSYLTYEPGVNVLPTQPVAFRDLVRAVPSSTGQYVVSREDQSNVNFSNNMGIQAEGAIKGQSEYTFKNVTYAAGYIAAFTRFSRQMAQDIPYLTATLPLLLQRDFLHKESNIFTTALAAESGLTAATTGSTGYRAERIINEIASLESINFEATAIVVSPAAWATMVQYKGSGSGQYTYPGVVTVEPGGVLRINGIQIVKANWLQGTTKYWVGDFSYAKRVVVDDLSIGFFEQDADNVQRNLITCRIESREVLAVDQPKGFIYGDFNV